MPAAAAAAAAAAVLGLPVRAKRNKQSLRRALTQNSGIMMSIYAAAASFTAANTVWQGLFLLRLGSLGGARLMGQEHVLDICWQG
jgi:hypothetical protein